MDHAQSVFWLGLYEDTGLVAPTHTASPSLPRTQWASQESYDAAQLVLLTIPSLVLLLLTPIRALQLRRESLKVLPNYTGAIKAVLTIAIATAELAGLILCLASDRHDAYLIAAHAIPFVAALAACQLSFLEHGRSPKPSTLLIAYLLASLICDGFFLRSIFSGHPLSAAPPVVLAAISPKFLYLIVESTNKRSYLRQPYKELPIEQTVSDLNRTFLFWINELILLGSSKLLTYHDLPGLDDTLQSRGIRERMEDLWAKTESGTALLWALFKFIRGGILVNSIPRLATIVFRYSQPIFISKMIKYVTEPVSQGAESDITGYDLVLAAFIIYIGVTISFNIYYQMTNRLRVRSRGALISLIHARCLTMRDGVYDGSAAVTHMSSDVEGIEGFPRSCQELWALSVELLIGMTLLWYQVGWWCITPLVMIGCECLLTRTGRGNRILTRENLVSSRVQKRIALTTSMIDNIKTIKMTGMTDNVMARVQDSRITDISRGMDLHWIMLYFDVTAHGIAFLVPAVTLIAYAADAHIRGEGSFEPTTAFTSIAIITLVGNSANALLVMLPQFASAHGCAARIQKYLLEPSREDKRILLNGRSPENGQAIETGKRAQNGDAQSPAVIIDNVVLRPAATANVCLNGVSAFLNKGSLNVICGAVGTGKTTLARAILGDVPPDSGSICVSTKRIGYCAQKPWLFNTSIRTMVCGGLADEAEVDEEWYNSVLHACGLKDDIAQMTGGDSEAVGSRGVTLSGGQRQRVVLARAVYSRPEIIILDDVLSALDAKTEAHVAEMLLGPDGIFRKLGTTVILITHATQHLPLADLILVLGESKVVEQGTWAELRSSTGYVSKLQVKETDSSRTKAAADERPPTITGIKTASKDDMLDLTRKTGDFSLYGYYFKCIGGPLMTIFLLTGLTQGVTFASTPFILRMWTESGGRDMWLYTGMYALSSLLTWAATVAMCWVSMILISAKTGRIFHQRLLNIIMKAPLSYFAITDTGTILNRFSQDMSYVDQSLPFNMLDVSLQLFKLISNLVLVFLMQAFIAISMPFLFLVLYFLQKVYLQTSRQIRFLDIELKAVVFSNFLETLEGISHIRAFGWQPQAVDENVKKLDISQRPNYLMSCVQLWLGLVLGSIVTGLAVIVTSVAIAFKSTTTGGQIGIALNVILGISNNLARLMESWTQLETSLGSISRIKTLEQTVLPEDKEGEDYEPPPEWPEKGAIEFQSVVASYNPETIALKGITAKISPGQKVGICGRTGSGKSSLILSLLRLIELDSGSIVIDGLDLSTLPREKIRASLITIPQETFVLNDSIRLNIDPSGLVSHEEMIAVLEKVQLWNVIKSRGTSSNGANSGNAAAPSEDTTSASTGEAAPDGATVPKKDGADPLESSLKDSPLSHGQFQLFGLARALLVRGRSQILILDEATSNVDSKTDELMQRIIREEFARHTILTIAHRLDTIRDADVILVLDNGKLVETGAPGDLLAKQPAREGESVGEDCGDKAWLREMWDHAH
ncbi:P-loop containing nucleoside triphosphate hydrolase protein [Thozetella sp. PMI_491]|nr:P-loop containing nucleoside triphosphate hydrolase protein [Thozetella sp. PMI_491]